MKTARIKYSLRTMLILVSIVVALMAIAPPLHYWYTTVPLSKIVVSFNEALLDAPTLKDARKNQQHLLTEDEIIAAIDAELSGFDLSEIDKATLSRFVQHRRVPANTSISHYRAGKLGELQSVIALNFTTGPYSRGAIWIRKPPDEE